MTETITISKAEYDELLKDKVRLAGEAEAAAIRSKGEALKENRQLVDLTAAEKWNGVLPTTMTPSGSVPFVKVGQ